MTPEFLQMITTQQEELIKQQAIITDIQAEIQETIETQIFVHYWDPLWQFIHDITGNKEIP